MTTKVTYLIGAGASANAIPVVNRLTKRFSFFCKHLLTHMSYNNYSADDIKKIRSESYLLVQNFEKHYTIDTYAKKLWLRNKDLENNFEYCTLLRYLTAFFIYEQYNKSLWVDAYVESMKYPLDDNKIELERETIRNNSFTTDINIGLDYRYDSFYASILVHDDEAKIKIPANINIISWNYDSQFEKAFMNFTNCSFNQTIQKLNIIGIRNDNELSDARSNMIKLNGSASFYSNEPDSATYLDLGESQFDNKKHFKKIYSILSSDDIYETSNIRFAWEENSISNKAIGAAKQLISNSDIVIVIGYSFPYFNRQIDKELFSGIYDGMVEENPEIYLQAPPNSINSIADRFKGILRNVEVNRFTEVDQFLIPDEF